MGRLGPIFVGLMLSLQLVGLWSARCRQTPFAAEASPSIDIVSIPSAEGSQREAAWKRVRKWVRQANQRLLSISDIKGRFRKQERWGTWLEPPAIIEFQQLSEPLSIYLKWVEPHAGREVLFQQGQRGDRLVVLESTPLGTLAPTFLLSFDHPLARRASRHPIQELSLEYLRTEVRRYINRGQRNPDVELLIDEAIDLDGTPCRHVRITHPLASELAPKAYQRVDLYFRVADDLPVRWEKYGWPEGDSPDDAPLLEYFELLDVQYNLGASADDFRADHPDFGFGRLQIPLD